MLTGLALVVNWFFMSFEFADMRQHPSMFWSNNFYMGIAAMRICAASPKLQNKEILHAEHIPVNEIAK